MPLLTVFKLTRNDREKARKIKELLSQSSEATARVKLVKLIKSLKVKQLVLFAHCNLEFGSEVDLIPPDTITFISFCETEPTLQPYWQALILRQEIIDIRHFKVNKEPHLFTLLRSVACLRLARTTADVALKDVYTQEAIRLGSFFTCFFEAIAQLKKFCDNPTNTDASDTAIALAYRAVESHQEPGFYLLAVIYFTLGNIHYNNRESTQLASQYYKYAASCLSRATPLDKFTTRHAMLGFSFLKSVGQRFPRIHCENPADLTRQLEQARTLVLTTRC